MRGRFVGLRGPGLFAHGHHQLRARADPDLGHRVGETSTDAVLFWMVHDVEKAPLEVQDHPRRPPARPGTHRDRAPAAHPAVAPAGYDMISRTTDEGTVDVGRAAVQTQRVGLAHGRHRAREAATVHLGPERRRRHEQNARPRRRRTTRRGCSRSQKRTARVDSDAATSRAWWPRSSGVRMKHQEYDVFVSHASEDKKAVARPLAELLVRFGVRVWYDEDTLEIGDSLSESIDTGLASSRFGVVVLSRNFFSKPWARRELTGLACIIHEGRESVTDGACLTGSGASRTWRRTRRRRGGALHGAGRSRRPDWGKALAVRAVPPRTETCAEPRAGSDY